MSKPYWQGVFPAITNLKRISPRPRRHGGYVEALIKSGVSGIIFLGSLGENQPLRPDEKRLVMEAMIKVVNGRIPVPERRGRNQHC